MPRSQRQFAITGHGAHTQLVRALRQHQVHRSLSLQLQAERALEFQCRGQQHGCCDCFSQRVANGLRIVAMLEQGAPRSVEVHDVPPNRVVLEQKAVQTVAIVHVEESSWFAGQAVGWPV